MERLNVIVRVNYRNLHKQNEDLLRFAGWDLHNLFFKIPTVKVLVRKIHKGYMFDEKPLLFNYGFMEMPLEYTKDPNALARLKQVSDVVSGYFYKSENELRGEKMEADADGLGEYHPVLVKTITSEEVERLYRVASSLEVYDNVKELGVGAYVVLQGYPFEGVSAKVERKKTNGKIQVELVESGIKVWLEPQNVYYSSYTNEE